MQIKFEILLSTLMWNMRLFMMEKEKLEGKYQLIGIPTTLFIDEKQRFLIE
ncbi:hypothetical protein KHA80_18245 [Anaerobacillus sp. HL2]|nr:hypothetical protein KHA80_18245 [Anaerobacillus sp. HL2]